MTQVRFRDLTAAQRVYICNGCGGKGHWLKPPSWLFQACCDHHDFNYWLGYREGDRERADSQFYAAMLQDAAGAPWWLRGWRRLMAWVYYKAVARYGRPFFHYGERERTLEDLEDEMRGAA